MADITDPQPSFKHVGGLGASNRERLRGRANGLVRKPEGTTSFSGYDVMGWWQRLGKRQSVQSHSLPTQQRPVWITQSHQEPGKVWRVHRNPSTLSPPKRHAKGATGRQDSVMRTMIQLRQTAHIESLWRDYGENPDRE